MTTSREEEAMKTGHKKAEIQIEATMVLWYYPPCNYGFL